MQAQPGLEGIMSQGLDQCREPLAQVRLRAEEPFARRRKRGEVSIV
jgi:hypothetical protein